jgi:hypothetical protein
VRGDELGLPLRYRIGPAQDPHSAPSFLETMVTAEGIGLRPFAPAHLRFAREDDGALALAWVRRTRFGGTAWELAEVPLNEEREAYRVEILDGEQVVRSVDTDVPAYLYPLAEQSADFGGAATSFAMRIAQRSAAVGSGFILQGTVDA